MKKWHFSILLACVMPIMMGWGIFALFQVENVNEVDHPYKVIAPINFFSPNNEKVELLQEYDAYALYAVSDLNLVQKNNVQSENVWTVNYMNEIYFNDLTLNTQVDTLVLPEHLEGVDSPEETLWLVQFIGPIKQGWLEAVREAGGIPIHYVANNAYLLWTNEASRRKIDDLLQGEEFLQYSGLYQPFFKFAPSLRQPIAELQELDSITEVVVQVYAGTTQASTQMWLQQNSLAPVKEWPSGSNYQNFVVKLTGKDLIELARQPDVVWIGPYYEPTLTDEVQAQLLAGSLDASRSGPSGPGYLTWLLSLGFSQDPEDYPIIDITDDGIGNGSLNSGDPTLHVFGSDSNASRITYLTNCTSQADAGGPTGHGHINASISAGYDVRAGAPFQDSNGFNRGLGVNPYGRIAGSRIFAGNSYDISGCGNDLASLVRQSYSNGARISSNSWGCTECIGTYDVLSQLYDAASRDADLLTAGNQEMLFVFAAGNQGGASNTILTPGNAKNVLTVGGTENDRPTYTDNCLAGPAEADSVMDVIDFSSRGPAPGGRAKPEIVAPATHIQGTASTHPDYDGSTVCNQYYPDTQTIFASSTGTSHATPAVAGAASLYYYWLQNTYSVTVPSPALLKAYTLAHTTYLTGTNANDTLPSNNQGYGLPNLGVGFDDAERILVNQTTIFDQTGETWSLSTSVADPARPVRIMLAYTDQAGLVGSIPQVNDLNLQITINGTTYLGNSLNGQWSISGGAPDPANNYEAIFLPSGTVGNIEVTVTAFNIAGDGVPNLGDGTDQDFALVCYNCSQAPDFLLEVAPRDQEVCIPNAAIYAITSYPLAGYSETVDLTMSGTPVGATSIFTPSNGVPPATSQLTVTNTQNAPTGSYKLTITGTGTTQTHATTAWLHLLDNSPGTIALTSPMDGADNVFVNPTLNWDTAPPVSDYTVEIATDSGFADIVYQVITASDVHTVTTQLELDTLYYWRVRSENACGASSSTTFSFTTSDRLPVLLVDDDWGTVFGDARESYTSALDELSIYYDVWDVEGSGSEPSDSMLNYDAVIWFSGEALNPLPQFLPPLAGPEPTSEVALTTYLENGGCLLLSSQNYFDDRDNTVTDFMANFLDVDSVILGVNYTTITGTGAILNGLGPYTLLPPTFGGSDVVIPDNAGEPTFHSNLGGNNYPGIENLTDVYGTTYLGFGLEKINEQDALIDVLGHFWQWCSGDLISNDVRINFENTNFTVDEGDEVIPITISLSESSPLTVSVDISSFDQTATVVEDYEVVSDTISFAPGDTTHIVSVAVLEDMLLEGNEQFGLSLSNPKQAELGDVREASVLILDNEQKDILIFLPVVLRQ